MFITTLENNINILYITSPKPKLSRYLLGKGQADKCKILKRKIKAW